VRGYSFNSSFPLREIIKMRGLLNSSFFFLLHPRERARVRGSFKIFSIFSSLPLRERIKVRGAVKFFSSPFFPLHFAGEGRVRGIV
jgi:hypothetical protein